MPRLPSPPEFPHQISIGYTSRGEWAYPTREPTIHAHMQRLATKIGGELKTPRGAWVPHPLDGLVIYYDIFTEGLVITTHLGLDHGHHYFVELRADSPEKLEAARVAMAEVFEEEFVLEEVEHRQGQRAYDH